MSWWGLWDCLILLMFLYTVYSIAGTQLYKGILQFGCEKNDELGTILYGDDGSFIFCKRLDVQSTCPIGLYL